MKTIIRTFVLVFAAIAFASAANAQKFAHVSSDSLVSELSLKDSIQAKVEAKQKEYQGPYQMLIDEYNRAQADYNKKKNDKTMPPSLIDLAYKTVEGVATRMQEFEQAVNQEIQEYQQSLMLELWSKIKKATEEVAKEKGYTYVLDNQALLVSPQSEDITNLVRKKLGL